MKTKNDRIEFVCFLLVFWNFYEINSKQAAQHEHQEQIHQEMMTIQIKYQREIDRLEKEVKAMKKQILLRQHRNLSGQKQRKIKVAFLFE